MIDSMYPYEIMEALGNDRAQIVTRGGSEIAVVTSVEAAAQRIAQDVADGYPEVLPDFLQDFADGNGVALSETLVKDDRFIDSLAEEILELHRGPAMKMGR